MALHDEFRTHRLEVTRIERVPDGQGGFPETPVVVGTIDGSLQPLFTAKTKAGEAERAEFRWQFYCDPGTDLRRDDMVVVVAVRRLGEGWVPVPPRPGSRMVVLSVGEWIDPIAGLDHVVAQVEDVQTGG
jgi:hypothetical protein